MVIGLILAGGESRRFGDNKLVAKIDGSTVIDRVFNNLSRTVNRIFVSVRNRSQERVLLERCIFINSDSFGGFVYDINNCGGPLCGILSFKGVGDEEVIVVPGDVPWITYDALESFLNISREYFAYVSSPIWGNGFIESLIIYFSRRKLTEYTDILYGIRLNGRPSDFHRIGESVLFIPVSYLTDSPKEFAHVNYVGDLENPKAKNPFQGVVNDFISIKRDSPKESFLYRALESFRRDDFIGGLKNLVEELEFYVEKNLFLLAEHVALDIAGFIKKF